MATNKIDIRFFETLVDHHNIAGLINNDGCRHTDNVISPRSAGIGIQQYGVVHRESLQEFLGLAHVFIHIDRKNNKSLIA